MSSSAFSRKRQCVQEPQLGDRAQLGRLRRGPRRLVRTSTMAASPAGPAPPLTLGTHGVRVKRPRSARASGRACPHGYDATRERDGRGRDLRRPVAAGAPRGPGGLARSPPDRAEAVAAFARVFTRRLSTADVAEMPEDELAGVVVSAFDLADSPGHRGRRRPGPSDRRDRGRLRDAGLGPPDQRRRLALPVRLGQPRARVAGDHGPPRTPSGRRDRADADDGRIARVTHAKDARARESVMHFELGRRLSTDEAADLEQAVRNGPR